MLTLKPFLEGKGPTLEIDLAQGSMLATWGGDAHEVFEWDPDDYHPGMGCTSEAQEVDDILSFAMAYAEDGDGFDRDPEDLEQVWGEFWAVYGDAFTCEIQCQIEETD